MHTPAVDEGERLAELRPRIRSMANHYAVPGVIAADDLEQEGLLAALEAMRGWTGRSKAEGLFIQRAHWRMKDAVRRASRRRTSPIPDSYLAVIPSHEGAVCDRLLIEQALSALSALQAAAVQARYFLDDPVWQTAEVMGIKRITASGALRRALLKMRAVIEA